MCYNGLLHVIRTYVSFLFSSNIAILLLTMILKSKCTTQEELGGIEPKRRMRYENPSDARLLREAYARTTRRPHTETFAEKMVRALLL